MSLENTVKHWLHDPEVVNVISGAMAGALTAAFVCPLDVLKTRLQVQRIGLVREVGIVGGLAQIVRQQGVSGLYQGLGPTLAALLPNWAVYFTVYDKLKIGLTTQSNGCKTSPGPLIHMTAAAGAGVATLFVTNPFWVIKTRMQTHNLAHGIAYQGARRMKAYRGTWDALFRIANEEGMRGLYSGLAPSLIGIAHVCIQFPLYEFSKQTIAERQGTTPETLSAGSLVTASAFSKMVASTVTYPHEVVRSYMHVSGSGPLDGLKTACKTLWKEDGVRGFYRGCLTNLLRTTPAAALTFTSFELIARGIRHAVQEMDAMAAEGLKNTSGSNQTATAQATADGSSFAALMPVKPAHSASSA